MTSCGRRTTVICHLLLLLLLACPATPRPAPPEEEPRWVNPCDLPPHLLLPASDHAAPAPPLQAQLAAGTAHRARLALQHASRLLDDYLKETFKDPTFIQGTAIHRLNWLPRPNRSEVRNMSIREAYRYFYSTLQYYGVALEQMITDQVLQGGPFLASFRRGEDLLAQVLCELQAGAYTLGARPSPDVLRDVMARQYRDPGSRSQRNLRDLLVLRDYVHLLAVMRDAFRDHASSANRR